MDRDAGADSDEGGQSTFVKGERAFLSVDSFGRFKGVGVLCCGLKPDFYNIERLTWTWSVVILSVAAKEPKESW